MYVDIIPVVASWTLILHENNVRNRLHTIYFYFKLRHDFCIFVEVIFKQDNNYKDDY